MALVDQSRTVKDRTTPWRTMPIAVFGGLACLAAGYVWIAALTPPVLPTLTVDPFNSWTDVGISAALLVGTLLGVRFLYIFLWGLTVLGDALILSEAVINPGAQTIGGAVLVTVALAVLLLPSVRRYERKRVRLVLE